nr:putative reverse transcriptase domain-containing protein [Tanacetum cinerariifolium]
MSAKTEEQQLKDIIVVRSFPEVFPDDLSGLPPSQEFELHIDLIPKVMPVAKSPYHLAPSEMEGLSSQLREIQDKGFIRPSSSHGEHRYYSLRRRTDDKDGLLVALAWIEAWAKSRLEASLEKLSKVKSNMIHLSGGSDGGTNGGIDGEDDMDLLRDEDGKSDGGGEVDNDKSDGGKDDDGKSDGGVGISFPSRREKVGLVGRDRVGGEWTTDVEAV